MQNDMTNDTAIASARTCDTIRDRIHETSETVKKSVVSASDTICSETGKLCECASEGIRKSPIAYVAGAAFFGAAVCYLILEGRHQPSFSERYIQRPLSDAGTTVSDSIHSLFGNFKFW